jgi:hypothetical protein
VPPETDPNADCDSDGTINKNDADDDNDLLSDATEAGLSKLLDPCKWDTDGDGAGDGYEYQSARDLNDDEHESPNEYTPYPRKLPYPNPLDGEDEHIDHDGDDLTLLEEFQLWNYAVSAGSPRTLEGLTYSAGEQYSVSSRVGGTGNRVPTLNAVNYDKHNQFLQWAASAGYATVMINDINDPTWWDGAAPFLIRNFDRDGGVEAHEELYYDYFANGRLDDSERDEDADGLTNSAETRGCMRQDFWKKLYPKESPYYLSYEGTRLDDPDTDGDGIRDGADDQDHDDLPNVMECSRRLAADHVEDDPDADPPVALPDATRQWEGWVNPFNPCLPYTESRSCKKLVTIDKGWAPFDTEPEDAYRIFN